MYLKPGVRIVPLPASVPAEALIGGGCGLPTALHAVERSDVLLGQTVLVQGTGPVGLSSIALSRLRGPHRVIAIGAPQMRLEAALRMGADVVLDVEETTVEQRREAVVRADDVLFERAQDDRPAFRADTGVNDRDVNRLFREIRNGPGEKQCAFGDVLRRNLVRQVHYPSGRADIEQDAFHRRHIRSQKPGLYTE